MENNVVINGKCSNNGKEVEENNKRIFFSALFNGSQDSKRVAMRGEKWCNMLQQMEKLYGKAIEGSNNRTFVMISIPHQGGKKKK